MTSKCLPCVKYAIFDIMGEIMRAVISVVKCWLHKMSNQLKLIVFCKKRIRNERDNPSEECFMEE